MKSYSIIEDELSKILSNNNNDSVFSEKCDLEPLINNIKTFEILIQSIFKGYLFRKKYNEIDGLKLGLIEKNNEEIKNIEKNFISKITLKGEKFIYMCNWKNYYDFNEINDLLEGNIIIKNNNKEIIIKAKYLLSKYKNENCLYKGSLSLNSIQKNKNKKRKILI